MDLHDLLERLARLPRVQRLALMGVVYVLFAAVFWFLLYSPQRTLMDGLNATQADLRTKKAVVERRAQDKDAFEQELEELTVQLRQALRQLPDDREIPDLLSRISTTGRRLGLEVRKFLPRSEVIREYHAEVPVQLELGGSYHEVAMFFDRLSKLSRIVSVQDVEIVNPKETGGKVTITVIGTLTTYRFLSEDERSRSQEAAQKGDRKPRRRARGAEE